MGDRGRGDVLCCGRVQGKRRGEVLTSNPQRLRAPYPWDDLTRGPSGTSSYLSCAAACCFVACLLQCCTPRPCICLCC